MKRAIFATLLLLMPVWASAGEIERAEPLSWWVDMKMPLQVMFHGDDLAGSTVTVDRPGLTVTGVKSVDNPDYLFVDMETSKAGEYTLTFTKGRKKSKFKYTIADRREGSADRKGFSTEDLIYLIMPDRFANGDPTNDTTPDTQDKTGRDDYFGRHGGDIQGIIDHLDYMQGLGVTAMWSTPMLLDDDPRGSYHGYAAADYYRIDPRFGSNELYRKMVDEAHGRGIKIVMDVVPNHCGRQHPWMSSLPTPDWINFTPDGGFISANHLTTTQADPYASDFDRNNMVRGWFSRNMPDINLANPLVLRYFQQWAIWWIEYSGLDGFRVDTFTYSDKESISKWMDAIMTEYPNFSVVGETWFPSSPEMAAWWHGDNDNRDGYNSHLPLTFDFPLWSSINEGLTEKNDWEKGMMRIYHSLTHDIVFDDPMRQVIFLDNHDTMRITDKMEGDADKVKLALTLLGTMRGIPQMYYGAELLFRSEDTAIKDGPQRVDFPGGWFGDKSNLFEAADRTAEQQEVFDHAQKLFNWRKGATAIHNGRTMHFHNTDNSYVFFRQNDAQTVMVVVNAADAPKQIEWETMAEITSTLGVGRELFTGARVVPGEAFTVEGVDSAVVVFE